jgi:hypothetical protein
MSMLINYKLQNKHSLLFTVIIVACIFVITGCQIISAGRGVDNFEDSDNVSLLTTQWYLQDDSPDGGNSKIEYKIIDNLGAGGTKHCMQIDYKLGGLFRWPYVQAICPLVNEGEEYFDLSAYSGISFYAKSKNLNDIRIVFLLFEEGITDYNNSASFRPCEISLETTDTFKEYEIDFSKLKTATWWQNRYPKAAAEPNWSKATALLIMEDDSLRAGAEETLWVDEIAFYRSDLEIGGINPSNNQQGVKPQDVLNIHFNFPIEDKKIDNFIAFKRISAEDEVVDFSYSFSNNNRVLTITPKNNLSLRSRYSLTIEKGLKSIYGNSLQQRHESVFYTKIGKGNISGTVKDAEGNPVSQAKVVIYPQNIESSTDNKGCFNFKGVELDNIVLYCIKDGFYTGFAKSGFSPEGNLSIIFKLDKVPPVDNQINPYIFGVNYNDWETSGYLLPVVDKVREAGFTLIRWGGIGKDLIEVDEEAIDEFITFAKDIQAEPMIEVRLIRGTVEEAAEIVRYCNIEKGYNVKYWLIGNEPDAYNEKNWGPYNAKDYASDYRKYYNAMKSVDPTIKIGGPELMSKYWLSASDNWVTPFLKDCSDIVDFLSIHIYLFDGKQPVYQSLMGQKKVRYLVESINDEIKKVAKRQIPLIITEYNLTWDWVAEGEGACNSIAAGLWLADFLGTLAQKDVYMATFWDIMERGTIGFLEHETYKPYPTYYTFMIYKLFRGKILEVQSDDSNLAVYASENNGKKILVLINKRLADRTEVEIGNLNLESSAECQVRVQGLDNIKQQYYSLPPLSLTRLIINQQGILEGLCYYSKETYDKNQGIRYFPESQEDIIIQVLTKEKTNLTISENVLDNFEDDNYSSFKGGVWIAEDDSVNNGNSLAEITLIKEDSNNRVLKFDYKLGDKFHNRYAICAVVFDEPLDLTAYSGITFKARGTKVPIKVKVCSQAVGDYDYHGNKILMSDEWQSYEIKFDELKQEGWGKAVNLDLSSINKIQFETALKKVDEAGYIEIDDIVFIKK